MPQIVFDGLLILRGRRNDFRIQDRSVFVDAVAMIEDAARRFGAAVAGASARFELGTAGFSGGSYCSMIRNASSQA